MAALRENTVIVTTANASMDMDPQAMDIATKLQPPEKKLTLQLLVQLSFCDSSNFHMAKYVCYCNLIISHKMCQCQQPISSFFFFHFPYATELANM